jgi:hypothetical protein
MQKVIDPPEYLLSAEERRARKARTYEGPGDSHYTESINATSSLSPAIGISDHAINQMIMPKGQEV